MKQIDKNKLAYNSQKCSAKKRGIDFQLSYDEWKSIWDASGKPRGRGKDFYCMARHNDTGPYALWNVSIITNSENLSLGNKDRWKNKVVSEETKAKIRNKRAKQLNVGYDKSTYVCPMCSCTLRGKSNLIQHTRARHGE